MKTSHLFAAWMFPALLALTSVPAWSNGAPPRVPYRRPTELAQPLDPTTQAHLDATQDALHVATERLNSFNNPSRRGGAANQYAFYYGGYLKRAQVDLDQALSATAEAAAYLRAHPDLNVLATGPAPLDDITAPAIPSVPSNTFNASDLVQALDAVNAAVEALVNNPARDYRGPIMGDLGGHRAKVLAAVAQVGRDLNNSFAYYQNTRGGSTGIIPLSAPAGLPADPKYGPTTRMYLQQAQSLLTTLVSSIASAGSTFAGDQTQGGYVPKVQADLDQTASDLSAALAYIDKHPEADALEPGPAGVEPPAFQPARGTGTRGRGPAPKLTTIRINSINSIATWLRNTKNPDIHGPVLGDIDGYRTKILLDLIQAQADTQAGIEFTAQDPTVTPVPARQGNPLIGPGPSARQGNPPSTSAPAPGAMLDPRPTATTNPSPLPGPTGLAGLALSLGASLGGLFLVARRK